MVRHGALRKTVGRNRLSCLSRPEWERVWEANKSEEGWKRVKKAIDKLGVKYGNDSKRGPNFDENTFWEVELAKLAEEVA